MYEYNNEEDNIFTDSSYLNNPYLGFQLPQVERPKKKRLSLSMKSKKPYPSTAGSSDMRNGISDDSSRSIKTSSTTTSDGSGMQDQQFMTPVATSSTPRRLSQLQKSDQSPNVSRIHSLAESGDASPKPRTFTFKKRTSVASSTTYDGPAIDESENSPDREQSSACPLIADPVGVRERERLVLNIVESTEDAVLNYVPPMSSRSATFEVKPVVEDGNSFYRSIAYLTFGVESKYTLVRTALLRYMKDKKNYAQQSDRCMKVTGIPNIQTYFIRNLNVFNIGVEPGELELNMAAIVLRTTLYVFDSDVSKRPKLYLPQSEWTNSKANFNCLILQRLGSSFRPVVKYDRFCNHVEHIENRSPPRLTADVADEEESQDDEEYEDEAYATTADEDEYEEGTTESATTSNTTSTTSHDSGTSSSTKEVVFIEDDEYEEATTSAGTGTSSKAKEVTIIEDDVFGEVAPHRMYTYAEDQDVDAADLCMVFDSDESKSTQDNIDDAVNQVFREKRLPGPRLRSALNSCSSSAVDIRDILNESDYVELAEYLNENPEMFESTKVLDHLRRVMSATPLVDLKYVTLDDQVANESKLDVMRMRRGLTSLRTSLTFRPGTSKEKVCENVMYGCVAFTDSERDRRNGFAYYHPGKDGTRWTWMSINPRVFDVVEHFQPGKTLVMGGTVFTLTNRDLAVVNLFGDGDVKRVPLPCKKSMFLALTRSNRHQLYLLNTRLNRYCTVSEDAAFSEWNPVEINRQNVAGARSKQLVLVSPGKTEIVVLPMQQGKAKTISDIYAKQTQALAVSTIHEFVVLDQKENKFRLTSLEFGIRQVKVSACGNDDTKYLLVDMGILNREIGELIGLDS
jgi:hypothetical protein